MSPHVRKVRTASGATAVQVVTKRGGRRVKIVHVGSAHSEAELAVLEARARAMLPQQGELDLGLDATDHQDAGQAQAVVAGQSSALLWQVLQHAWRVLGLDTATGGDRAFEQMCLARLVEPTSKAQVPALIADLGIVPVSCRSLFRSLSKAAQDDYRAQVQRALHAHATAAGDLSLVLYDVTTLYFETASEDKVSGPNQGLRRVGYSKERRVDPQVILGLLTDRTGFPLRVGMWEGNKAETTTIIPTITQFLADTGRDPDSLVVVADAGMLSATNLQALQDAGVGFIVGSRQTKAPYDLATRLKMRGTYFADGEVTETITPRRGQENRERNPQVVAEPVWDPDVHTGSWRAIWQYRTKRARREEATLKAQWERAQDAVSGARPARKPRFVTIHKGDMSVDEDTYQRAQATAGMKGYVTNLPATRMDATEVIASYHALWHVEASFRMSKHDLAARPVFHHAKDAIDAHLTVVIASLAVARDLTGATGMSIKTIVRTLRPLRQVTIRVGAHDITAHPQLTDQARTILTALNIPEPGH